MRISQIHNMPNDFELILFGDKQEGNIACAHDKHKECIDYIMAAENRYGVNMGDCMDAFWCDDVKRYDPATCKITPAEQKKNVIRELTALAKTGRLISILKGNHERALETKYGDINAEICEELRKVSGGQYPITGTYTNKLEFYRNGTELMFKGYFTHGRKAISSVSPDPHRKRANMQYRLKLILEHLAGDCILMAMGHCHLVLVTPPLPAVYLTTEKGKLKQHYTHAGSGKSGSYIPPDSRWYGATGSFLKTFVEDYETYSELGQMAPTEIGYLKAIVQNKTVVDLQEVKI
jgi:hypothetical protein